MSDREEIVQRIKDCETVINEFDNVEALKIIVRDAELWVDRLDEQWQNIYLEDKSKLEQSVILKLAYMHLLNLKENYKSDMKRAQDELYKVDNPDKEVGKDYDNESNYE